MPTDTPDDLGLSNRATRTPTELEQQAEVIAHGTVTGDLVVGDGEDVDLFVGDRPAGRGSVTLDDRHRSCFDETVP